MFGSILIFIHIFVCLIIIGLVLLQQGKGANLGASFGGGGDSFFGATGADNMMTRITTIAAIFFMATSLTLAVYHRNRSVSFDSNLINAVPEAQPAAPAPENEGKGDSAAATLPVTTEAEKTEGAAKSPDLSAEPASPAVAQPPAAATTEQLPPPTAEVATPAPKITTEPAPTPETKK